MGIVLKHSSHATGCTDVLGAQITSLVLFAGGGRAVEDRGRGGQPRGALDLRRPRLYGERGETDQTERRPHGVPQLAVHLEAAGVERGRPLAFASPARDVAEQIDEAWS